VSALAAASIRFAWYLNREIDRCEQETSLHLWQAVSGSVGGGAVSIEGNYASNPTFIGCTFTANVGDSGGAIYVASDGLTLQECFFDGNSAVQNAGGRGGAVMSAF